MGCRLWCLALVDVPTFSYRRRSFISGRNHTWFISRYANYAFLRLGWYLSLWNMCEKSGPSNLFFRRVLSLVTPFLNIMLNFQMLIQFFRYPANLSTWRMFRIRNYYLANQIYTTDEGISCSSSRFLFRSSQVYNFKWSREGYPKNNWT